MRKYVMASLLVGMGLGLAPGWAQHPANEVPARQAPAPARPLSALEGAFAAADMGDLAPLRRALPAARGDAAALIRARLALARFDPLPANAALARIAAGPDPILRREALSILTTDALLRGAYQDAGRWGRTLNGADVARGDAARAGESERTAQVAALLVGHPRQTIEGAIARRSIPARTDRVGLPRIDVAVNGQAQEAVFDTGAGLSVLSAETARRLGVTALEGEARVGNGVRGTVAVRLGVADRLEIAGTMLRNVPFLIIDDSQLTFPLPGGYDIRAIIGLPVIRALGRVRMEPAAGRFTVLAAEQPRRGEANLVSDGGQLFVAVGIEGRDVPLHLDTGANHSSLTALYAADHPDRIAALSTGDAHAGSAGGTTSARVAQWRGAPLALAGRTMLLPSLPIELPGQGGPPPRNYGNLGSDALRAFESYTLDFEAMRLELGPPVPAPTAAPAPAH